MKQAKVLITGILELLPAVTTWAREILSINEKLDPSSYPHRTIEERNSRSLKLMDISNVPRFNWTVDETNGDITGKINFCLAHQIQQPILKLQILNFHEFFFNQLDCF